VEERLRIVADQLQLLADTFEGLAISSEHRGGEGLSERSCSALARICAIAVRDLEAIRQVLPVQALNLTTRS
jgi:hypothetical protein